VGDKGEPSRGEGKKLRDRQEKKPVAAVGGPGQGEVLAEARITHDREGGAAQKTLLEPLIPRKSE